MTERHRHPDLLTDVEAVEYLRLVDVCPSPQSALGVLERLRSKGKIQPITWAKSFLYHRATLDRFIASEAGETSKLDGGQPETHQP